MMLVAEYKIGVHASALISFHFISAASSKPRSFRMRNETHKHTLISGLAGSTQNPGRQGGLLWRPASHLKPQKAVQPPQGAFGTGLLLGSPLRMVCVYACKWCRIGIPGSIQVGCMCHAMHCNALNA
eukprot:scaffold273102_cov22-Tisochrysis_lutea.AAC.1